MAGPGLPTSNAGAAGALAFAGAEAAADAAGSTRAGMR